MHVFPYSSRPGTSAAHFRDDVPPQVKSERVGRLIALSKEQGAKYRARFLGTSRQVLWEFRKAGMWVGLTDNYLRVTAALRSRTERIKSRGPESSPLNGQSVIAEVSISPFSGGGRFRRYSGTITQATQHSEERNDYHESPARPIPYRRS